MNPPLDRRRFLGSAAALPLLHPAAAGGLPDWWSIATPRCLVVLELTGGNDGLNTILPLKSRAWREARPKLAAVRKGALPLGEEFALHPQLVGFHGLVADRLAAVVQGVGFPGETRSHFKDRDIWHTGDIRLDGIRADTTGWLGRTADRLARGGCTVPGLSVGSVQVPLVLRSRRVMVPSVRRIEDYQLIVSPGTDRGGRRQQLLDLVGRSGEGDDLRGFLGSVARTAVGNAEALRHSLAGYRAKARYPSTELGRKLQLLSRILVSGLGTRLYHVEFGGFDTHASQLSTHAALLRQFSDAVTALVRDLHGHRRLDEVLILVHSEFGRRLAENRSGGTDHGKAGPMFLCGGGVRPGLHGEHPSLTDLDEGDLRPTVDFRSVYAAALRWLGVSPREILGEAFPGFEPFSR